MGTRLQQRKGSVLIHPAALINDSASARGSLMKWVADDAYQVRYDLARSQACYVAQQGETEKAWDFREQRKFVGLTILITSLRMNSRRNAVSSPAVTKKPASIGSKTSRDYPIPNSSRVVPEMPRHLEFSS